MRYERRDQLPEPVRDHLPEHAQEIYRQAFNHAYEEYADPAKRHSGGTREGTAHAVAWAAVEHEYAKGSDGQWVRKDAHG